MRDILLEDGSMIYADEIDRIETWVYLKDGAIEVFLDGELLYKFGRDREGASCSDGCRGHGAHASGQEDQC